MGKFLFIVLCLLFAECTSFAYMTCDPRMGPAAFNNCNEQINYNNQMLDMQTQQLNMQREILNNQYFQYEQSQQQMKNMQDFQYLQMQHKQVEDMYDFNNLF